MPGTAAGTWIRKHCTVSSAIRDAGACSGQPFPAMTMFGFRSVPRRSTRWTSSSWNVHFSVRVVTS